MSFVIRDSSIDESRHGSRHSVKAPGSPHSDYELRPRTHHDCHSCTHSEDFSWHDTAINNIHSHSNPILHPHHHSVPIPIGTVASARHPDYPTFPYVTATAASTRPHHFPTASKRLTRYDPATVGGHSYLNANYKEDYGETDKFYKGTSAYP